MLERMRRICRVRPVLPPGSAFAGFRFPREVIVLAVRWYLRYNVSYRDVEELLVERGLRSIRPRPNPTRDQPGRPQGSAQADPRRTHQRVPPRDMIDTSTRKPADQAQNPIFEPTRPAAR
jgi:hypothetical protein